MTTPLIVAAVVFTLFACLPFGVKWFQRRVGSGGFSIAHEARVLSAIAVGQNQRVVTVEVGPSDAKVWLVLGVTTQSITCLHSVAQTLESELKIPSDVL
jgi:flagellar protein FliO/FliZ